MSLALLPWVSGTSSWAATDQLVGSYSKNTGLTKSEFRQVLAGLERAFSPLAAEHQRTLEFQYDWEADWAQAFARRWESDQIVVYGGLARIPGATTDSLALILCHELGHLYGGAPFGDEFNQLSLEGQADYWATQTCWPRAVSELPLMSGTVKERALKAALVATALFAANRRLPAPQVETPDLSTVEVTLKTHPEPQCRLDTFVAGLENRERPRCWWAPSEP